MVVAGVLKARTAGISAETVAVTAWSGTGRIVERSMCAVLVVGFGAGVWQRPVGMEMDRADVGAARRGGDGGTPSEGSPPITIPHPLRWLDSGDPANPG